MEKLFSADFWNILIEKMQSWFIVEFPGLIILIVVIFLVFRLLTVVRKRLKKTLFDKAEKNPNVDTNEAEKRINTLVDILHGALKIVVWAVFFMIFLKKFGVDIGPVIASAGIIGLAVGFGAQELVRDFISGFFMLLEDQVRTGDVAVVNGTGGLVEKIELRTITLRDFSGTVHVIQNGKINSMANMTKEWSAMVFDVGVAYKEDVDRVIRVMKQVGDDLKEDEDFGSFILEPIEIFGLDKFADSAVVIKARLKTKPMQQWAVGREYRRRLKAAFDRRGIEIPFPHTSIYWGSRIDPLKLKMDKKVKTLLD